MAASSIQEEPIKTCFDDPTHFSVKHPLQHRWTLWFDNPNKKATSKDWTQNLKKVITIDSVEDFWGVYNYLSKASDLPVGANYHLFKEGIEPSWEDPANKQGGKWAYMMPKQKRNELDQHWLDLMLACIGESFTHGDEICGAVISIRKGGDRLALWTKTADDKEKTLKVGDEMSQALGNPERLGYVGHDDAAAKKSSFSKERYVI